MPTLTLGGRLGRLMAGVALACSCAAPAAPPPHETSARQPEHAEDLDAVIAAPAHHRILLENDRVRVLDVVIQPHTREPLHTHRWPAVLHVLEAGDFRDYDDKGAVLFDSRTAPPLSYPMTRWMRPQAAHAVENLSARQIHLIRVELKP